MSSALIISGRRLVTAYLLFIACNLLVAKATYTHTSIGNIDVISSMSEARTTKMVHELLAVKEVLADLLDVPMPQPSTQMLIFSSQPEMDEFFPKLTYVEYHYYAALNTKWSWTATQEGATFSFINEWPNDKRYRQAAFRGYATWLIDQSLPQAPFWFREGLADFVCTLEARDGLIRLGASIIEEKGATYASRMSLEKMLVASAKPREMCGLWRMWLTEDYQGNRSKVRALVAHLRRGGRGDGASLTRIFGTPLAGMETALNKHMRRLGESTVDVPSSVAHHIASLRYDPPTDFELEMARAAIATVLGKPPADLRLRLLRFADTHPESPRPAELFARLALRQNEETDAEHYWQQAMERGSNNAEACLNALRQRLRPRTQRVDLKPSLPAQMVEEYRTLVDRSVAANAGSYEAYGWLAWIEALAPEPQVARLQFIRDSKVRFAAPAVCIPLAVVYLRLNEFEEARGFIEDFKAHVKNPERSQQLIDFLTSKTVRHDSGGGPVAER